MVLPGVRQIRVFDSISAADCLAMENITCSNIRCCMSIGKEFMSSFGEEIRVLPRRAFWRKTRCQFWKDKEKIQRCQLCMDRVFPSWFGAGAVLEGEIGAESSLRRLGAALERICMYSFGKEMPTCALVPHGIGLQNFGACRLGKNKYREAKKSRCCSFFHDLLLSVQLFLRSNVHV